MWKWVYKFLHNFSCVTEITFNYFNRMILVNSWKMLLFKPFWDNDVNDVFTLICPKNEFLYLAECNKVHRIKQRNRVFWFAFKEWGSWNLQMKLIRILFFFKWWNMVSNSKERTRNLEDYERKLKTKRKKNFLKYKNIRKKFL